MARRARQSRAGLERFKHLVSLLREMNFAFNNIRLYPPTHTEVSGAVSRLHEGLAPVLQDQDDVGFGFMDEMLYVEGAMSIEETSNNQMLVDRFTRCRVKYLTIGRGVTREELLTFFTLMNAEAVKPTEEPPGDILARGGVKTIHVVEADVDDLASKSKLTRRRTLFDWYEKSVGTLKAVHDQLLKNPQAELKPLYRMVDDMAATMRSKGHEPFLLLPALGRGLDPHMTHALNACIYSCAIGDFYGLNSGQIQTLCVAACVHDTGRCIIPAEWASDPSPLTLFERAVVHQHSSWGFLLLLRQEEVPPAVALLAARHHDPATAKAPEGSYSPDTLHRILHLADAYDLAAFSDRYYWRKHRQDRVLKRILRRRSETYDPTLVKLLVQCVGYFPPGTLVRLADGRRAIVVRPNPEHVARPKVYCFEASDKDPEAPPEIVDLAQTDPSGLAFASSVAGVFEDRTLDARAILDKKKEFLLAPNL
ncbi:MAG: HD domain-containing protein [Elusimicrobiota bacterium]